MRLKTLAMIGLSLLLVIGAVLTNGCAKEAGTPTQITKDVTPQEAFKLIQENRGNPNFIIIDVRTPQEFAEGHIESGMNIDFRSDAFTNEVNKLDKAKKYLLYCRSGNRSGQALNVLIDLGFEEIYHLSVGTIGWSEAGYQLVK